ncbi:MAG: glutathione peroxidase [Bacteroidia bacterium]|jgi:glutathione peroxidase|nr:glutathione peroxidase [Bacteroidia bacterium]
MKKAILFSILLLGIISVNAQKAFHDFVVNDIDGKPYALSSLKGKKVMVVNTASKCGLTPQYAKLEKLYEQYGSDKFVIIGFPANNFMSQEPGTNAEIKAFCTDNYGVSFPMMSKISVKGNDMHPLYKWLTSKELNGVEDSSVSWNFQKYLIDEQGRLVKVLSPRTDPLDKEITSWIKGS